MRDLVVVLIVRVEMDECFRRQPSQIISKNNSCKTTGNSQKYVAITAYCRVEFITGTRGK